MWHPGYSDRYCVVQITSSVLNATLYTSVITTLFYNDNSYVPFMTL